MSSNQRFGLLGAAAIIMIVAFLALRPGEAETPTVSSNTTKPKATEARRTAGTATSEAPPTPKPSPGPLLGAGRVERLTATKGERVRFRVRSKAADELHVHGYDIRQDLAAGKAVPVSFEADIDGVFEVELEGAGEQVASLRVDP